MTTVTLKGWQGIRPQTLQLAEQLDYAAFDTRASFVVRKAQQPVIEKAGLQRVTQLENEAIGAELSRVRRNSQ